MRVIDLFCGAGGMSLGFARAGFEVSLGVDTDNDSIVSFYWAHGGAVVSSTPVEDMTWHPGSYDVVLGGPPCQPWSTGGKRLGRADQRDGWPGFVRAVHDIRPRAFVAENVPGFANTREMNHVAWELGDLGYTVQTRVLDAADYGVPQHRRRLFIVGTPGRFEWPEPRGRRVPCGSVITAQPFGELNQAKVTYCRTPTLRPSPYAGMLVNGGGRPLDLSRPAPTVLASASGNKAPWVDTLGVVPAYHAHLQAGGAARSGEVPGARRLGTDELAVLQGFPLGHPFAGARSSKVRQIGNAVPPPLAYAIACQLQLALRS